MKKLLFFVIAIILAIQGWTQVVTIGTGTTGVYDLPLNTYYRHSYTQQIFEASEIGTQTGVINSLSFQYIYGTPQVKDPVVVYIGNTSKTNFSSTTDWISVSNMTKVYNGNVYFTNTATDNWVNIPFDNSFVWDGTSNIVIAILNNHGSYSTSNNNTFNTHTTTDNKSLHYRVDGTTLIDPVNSSYTATGMLAYRNNIQLEFGTPITCQRPGGLTFNNTTASSIDITWPKGLVQLWDVEYKLNSETDWLNATAVIATDSTISLTNLLDDTIYDVRVRSNCGAGDVSSWRLGSFRTACLPISALPWTESFDTYGTGTTIFPNCWRRNTTQADRPYVYVTNPYSGVGSLYFYSTSTSFNIAATPPFDLTIPINTLEANFMLRKSSVAYNITVGVMTDPNDETTFTPIANLSPSTTNTWEPFYVNFNAYTGTGTYIAFKSEPGATNYMQLDDLVIDNIPLCARPHTLGVSNLTSSSADLTWIPGNTTDLAWWVYYKESFASLYDSVYATLSTLPLANLTPNTQYDFYVKTDCGTDVSLPSISFSFTTPCVAISAFPWSEGFESTWAAASGLSNATIPTSCWININGGASTTYLWRKSSTSTVPSYVRTGTGAAQLYGYNNPMGDYLITPAFTFTGNQQLVFWGKGYSSTTNYPENIWVKAYDVTTNGDMSSIADTSLFIDIGFINDTNQYTWNEYIFNLTNLVGDYRLVFARVNDVGYYYQLDDMVVDNIPACAKPTSSTLANLTATSVDISWTPGKTTDFAWWLYYKESTATTYDSVYVSGLPTYNFISLNPNTTYNYYIVTDCGVDISEETLPASFTTPCTEISTLPHTENFDNLGGTGNFPDCWTKITTYSTYPYSSTVNNSGPYSLYFYATSGNYNLAILNAIDQTININTLRVGFWMRKGNNTSNLMVGVMSDLSDPTSFVGIDTVSPSSTVVWEPFEVSLASYTGQGRYIAFKSEYNTTTNYLYLDDVVVDYIPACAKPTNIVFANITTTSADVSWTPGNSTDNAWWIYYKATGTSNWDSVYSLTNTYSFTTLSPMTTYEIEIRTDCGTELSEPSFVKTFMTSCSLITSLPYTESFDYYSTGTDVFPPCWGRKTTYSYYPYVNSTNNSAPGSLYFYTNSGNYNIGILPGLDPSINVSSLSIYFKLRKSNAADNITVGVMSDTANVSTFDSVANFSPSATSSWENFSVDFASYTGTGQYIAFRCDGYGGYNRMYIDDITLMTTPSCDIPTGLTRLASTTNSMTFDWDSIDDANCLGWLIDYKTYEDENWQTEFAATHPHTLSTLNPNIVYNIRLRAICSSGDTTFYT
ncbi:MAG: fibronectin type III domain-containing protein, partial [Bacteroidales bacterium]